MGEVPAVDVVFSSQDAPRAAQIAPGPADGEGIATAWGAYLPSLNVFVQAAQAAEAPAQEVSLDADVLMVGHSLVDPLLAPLQHFVRWGGGSGQVDRQSIPGAPLQVNWDDADKGHAFGVDGRARLAEGGTEILIVTDRVPVGPVIEWHDAPGYALRWHDLASASQAGAQVYLYESWTDLRSGTDRRNEEWIRDDADRDIPWRERIDLDLPRWEGIADHVNAHRAAGSKEMLVIPAGQALARLHDAIGAGEVPGADDIRAFFSDDIHLNHAGAYFVAMVHYATVYGRSPVGLPVRIPDQPALPADLAAVLQAIARETVEAYPRDGIGSGEQVETSGAGAEPGDAGPAGDEDAEPAPQAEPAPAAPDAGHGFSAEYFTLPPGVASLSEIDFTAPAAAEGEVAALDMPRSTTPFWEGGPADDFAARYVTNLTISTGGLYTFRLESDDGSALFIDGARVIDNDGVHPPKAMSVEVELEEGEHALEALYFEQAGEQSLRLEWEGPDTGGVRKTLSRAALGVNEAPETRAQATATGGASAPTGQRANDANPDGDALTIPDAGAAGHAAVTREDDLMRYMPAAGSSGADMARVNAAPPPRPGIPPSDGVPGDGLANPSLGMGLGGVSDWSTQQPFIDVMKAARSWNGHTEEWGAWSHDDLAAGGYLDQDGWLKAVPKGVYAVETLLLTDLPPDAASLAGRYRVTYDGAGKVEMRGRVSDVVYRNHEIWFDFTPGDGAVALAISRTDPRGLGDYIRNIEIVKAQNVALHEAGARFNPDWIELVKDLRAVRFMDWMATNDSAQSDPADRPRDRDYTYTRLGVPVEVMVALANEIGADPWFNMPHLASDAYMRDFATYVRDHLDPRLKAHAEYSNEVWNWQFGQAQWAHEQGQARWGDDVGDAWVQYYGMRAARMAMIWDEVFGPAADARLVKVISTQTGWLGLEEAILTAPRWVAEDPARNRPPAEVFDAYGVTGYFSAGLGGDEKASLVRSWIAQSRAAAERDAAARGLGEAERTAYVAAHGYDRAVALAARELRDGSVTGTREDSVAHLLDAVLPYQAEVAARNDLDLIMYEGGTHVVGRDSWVEDAELTDFFTHLNYTAEMGGLYAILLEGWRDLGGTLFNAFVDVGAPSKWGSWGARRTLDDENPRWEALDAFNRANPAWWEERAQDAFVQGVTLFGGEGPDKLEGGAKSDVLLGGGGDDLLIGNGGDDRLHGGEGEDTALLPGRRADYVFRPEGEALSAAGPQGVARLLGVETLRFAGETGLKVSALDLY